MGCRFSGQIIGCYLTQKATKMAHEVELTYTMKLRSLAKLGVCLFTLSTVTHERVPTPYILPNFLYRAARPAGSAPTALEHSVI